MYGVYILFSIVSPVISKVTGSNFNISNILDLEKYIEASSSLENDYSNFDNSNTSQIRNIYITNLKNDIKEKIANKGYIVEKIELEIENNEEYTIQKMTLTIKKQKEEEKKEQTNSTVNQIEAVNKIHVTVGNQEITSSNHQMQNINYNQENKISENKEETSNQNNKTSSKEELSSKEKNELQEYLSSVYEIHTDKIVINE